MAKKETPNVALNEDAMRGSFIELIGSVVSMSRAMRREVFSPLEKERIREAAEALMDLYRKR